MHGKLDLMALYEKTGSLYEAIIAVFETMPLAQAGLVLLAVTMIAFYATSFDALTMVASSYSYKALGADEEPDKSVKLFWGRHADAAAHSAYLLREFHGQPADGFHHCRISHWIHHCSYCVEFLLGCQALPGQ